MRIGTFNVRGLAGEADLVEEWWDRNNLACIGVTETWLRPTDRAPLTMCTESVALPLRGQQRRGHGGVLLGHKWGMPKRVLRKYGTEGVQYIAAHFSGRLTLVVIYVSPDAGWGEVQDCLATINQLGRGPTVIVGDLNARHARWDRKTNSRGAQLYSWARRWGWEIMAPEGPTFCAGSGRSTVDLFLVKGVQGHQPRLTPGPWDGLSDHRAIVADIPTRGAPPSKARPRITKSMLKNKVFHERVRRAYEEELPRLTGRVERVGTRKGLEKLYREIIRSFLAPWIRLSRPRAPRFKFFWDATLDQMAKKRSKLYRQFCRSQSERDWSRYREKDRAIKRIARAKKRALFETFVDELQDAKPADTIKKVNTLVKLKRGYASKALSRGCPLDPKKYTQYMSKNSGAADRIRTRRFQISRELVEAIMEATRGAPLGKAAGPDGITGDMCRVAPAQAGALWVALWAKCGELNYVPEAWRSAIVVPIHKKGAVDKPENYRPIALLSHPRKIVEKALDTALRKRYRFHPLQLGFRKGVGTELAILRVVDTVLHEHQWVAALDLKAAFDRVPKVGLARLLEQGFPPCLAAMTAHMLQPVTITTAGDPTNTARKLYKGVPQGSPLSPLLFDIFMDTLANELAKASPAHSEQPASLWADDVLLMAKSPSGLQWLLDVATRWAEEWGMSWNTGPGKSEVLGKDDERRFSLANKHLRQVPEVEYLGVTLDRKGLSAKKSVERIKKAKQRLGMLDIIGFNRRGFYPAVSIRVYETFVRPMTEYALPLTPLSPALLRASSQLELQFLRQAFGLYAAKRPGPYRVICRLESLTERRAALARRMSNRWGELFNRAELQELCNLEGQCVEMLSRAANRNPQLREIHDGLATQSVQEKPELLARRRWEAYNGGRKRRVPLPRRGELPPVLSISKDRRVRTMALQWYCHWFPRSPTKVIAQMGARGRQALNTIAAVLQAEAPTAQEKLKCVADIRSILANTE